jgi:predicted dehydrogenase
MAETSPSMGFDRRVRLGMVGGGRGAFIGAVHRIAARMDDWFNLIAGALSSDPERARASGQDLGLADERNYGSFEAMAKAEAARPDGIEAVSIVTPNHLHAPIAKAFLNAGIHVICDKPMTTTVRDAEDLVDLVAETGKVFVLTHNYTGYPMIRQARAMVAEGALGPIRIVQVEYPQDWLTEKVEETGSKQGEWRADPERSGAGGTIADIGSHVFNLATFVSGLRMASLCAELTAFGEGRRLDDDFQILIRLENGANGMLWGSQVAPGNENALKLRIYGAKGGLEWRQEEPNVLWYTPFGEPKRLITRNGAGSMKDAARLTRVPSGHPEGYLEGFANIYNEAARAIVAARTGDPVPPGVLFPSVDDGLAEMRFIEAAIQSSKSGGVWTTIE